MRQKSLVQWTCLLTAVMLLAPFAAAQEAQNLEAPHDLQLEAQQWALPAGVELPRKAVELADPQNLSQYLTLENGVVTPKATLFSETFEGGFPGSAWTTLSTGSANVEWGRSTRRRDNGQASAWCAQRGSDAPGPGQDVPPNTASWMITGPFDLSSVSSGSLGFSLWLETEPSFDSFFFGASVDGTNFTGFATTQDTNGWQRLNQDLKNWGNLGDLTGRPQVWFTFLYLTDSSLGFEGAYVDDVVLDGNTGGGGGGGGLNLTINQIDAGNCPTLSAIVSVTDDQGNPITGLTGANFSLDEDGSSQTTTTQTAGSGGSALAVTLVLDGSGSLDNQDIANVQQASNAFIDLLAANDRVAVYHFGTNVTLVQDYTRNRNAAKQAVNALTNNLGSTSLYDAVVDAAQHSTTVGGRRALLVMTDGRNNDSVRSLDQAINAARNAGVPVFTVGFGSADRNVLSRLANETGGTFSEGVTSGDLQDIFNRIGNTLNNQYILTWSTTAIDGASHNVSVQVRRQGQTARRTVTYSQANTPCANAVPCTPGPNTLCLNRGRFRVEVDWTNSQGATGPATVAPCGADDSGILWFFDPDNWEMLIKVLDGCAVNNHFWVFSAATTDVGFVLRVTDTQTGARKTYRNRQGVLAQAVGDTSAFATCP